jgi:formyltetrahydrofolate synthetase
MNKSKQGAAKAEPVVQAEESVQALEAVTKSVLDWKRINKLDSSAEYEKCGMVLVALKEQLNEADKQRKEIVDPLNGVVKHVNQKFKTYTDPRKELEDHLKFLMKSYLEEQRAEMAKLAEKEAKIAERKGAKQLAIDIRERALSAQPVPTNAAVTFRDKYTFKVTDLTKVPREYLCVDEDKMKKLCGPDAPKIPGIEFYKDTIVAVSA